MNWRTLQTVMSGVLVLAFCLALRVTDPPIFSALRGAGFDTLQRLWPRNNTPQPVRIIDIDEASLQSQGQWPWPRDKLAHIVSRLNDLGASVIAFDIIFAEPDRLSPSALAKDPAFGALLSSTNLPDNDKLLAAAIAKAPVVTAFASTAGTPTPSPPLKTGFAQTGLPAIDAAPHLGKNVLNLAILDEYASGVGSINIDLAADQGIARQLPLLWGDGKQYYPSLVLEALRVAQHVDSFVVNASAQTPNVIESIRVGSIEIPTSDEGLLQINYCHNDPALYLSVEKLFKSENDAELKPLIEGHIVLIGTSAIGLLDTRTSPLGEAIPGVSVHAQALEQILAGAFITRPSWVVGSEFLLTALLGLLLASLVATIRPSSSNLVMAVFVAGLAGLAATAFRNAGLYFDASFPITTMLLSFLATIAFKLLYTDRAGRQMRRNFSHYVAPSILAEIERNPTDLKLGGEMRDVTVLFADIQNFTPLSEKLSATDLVSVVNSVMQYCSAAILAEGGTIDKYMGDAVMAFWNAPVAIDDHQYHAAKAALAIRQNLKALNDDPTNKALLQQAGLWPIRIRIGLASGMAVVGNMGSSERFDYSVLGETVNTASRAESVCKHIGFDIAIAGKLTDKTKTLCILPAGRVPMKGKSERTAISALISDQNMSGLVETQNAILNKSNQKADLSIFEINPELATYFKTLPLRLADFKP